MMITLTAASWVVFAELDWRPGQVSQCEDRAHRIGQLESVLVQHLVLEGSLDVTMAKRLVEKQEIIDRALDGKGKLGEDLEPVVPGDDHVSVRRQEIEKLAATITSEQIQLVHQGMRELAARCDGAQALDGAGFSKIDARMGRSLADTRALSAKQAVLGMKLIRRYQGQIPEVAEALGIGRKTKERAGHDYVE